MPSTALERGTLKIKSMHITWLPIQGPEQKAAKAKALEYMSAICAPLPPPSRKHKASKSCKNYLPRGKTNAITPIRKVPFATSSQITAKGADLRG